LSDTKICERILYKGGNILGHQIKGKQSGLGQQRLEEVEGKKFELEVELEQQDPSLVYV
jgi:hypothetical protein